MNVGLSIFRKNKDFKMTTFISTQQIPQPPSDSDLSSEEGQEPAPDAKRKRKRWVRKQVKFIDYSRLFPSSALPSSANDHHDDDDDDEDEPKAITWGVPFSPSNWSTASDSSSPPPGTHSPTPPLSRDDERKARANARRRASRALKKAQSASPPPKPQQASTGKARKAREKTSPYTAALREKRIKKEEVEALSEEQEAEYAARVEEALKNPANKYYRRGVIERAIYGADYHLSKNTNKLANNASYRSPRERNRKVDDTPITTATPSYESQQRTGHDPVEHLPRQQVAEGLSPVHRPIPLVRIDNRGHPVSGIATWDAAADAAYPVSPTPSALFLTSATEQGQECKAFESLDISWADPTDYGHPFDLATPSQGPSYPPAQPYAFQDNEFNSRTEPFFTPFGNPSNVLAPSANPWLLAGSTLAELLLPGGSSGAW